MKKNSLLTVGLVLLSVTSLFVYTSCKNGQQNQQENFKVKLEDASEEDLDEVNEIVLTKDTSSPLLPTTGARGETWQSWEEIFNSCFKNETFRKNKVYLGPSNPKYLGTILSKDKNSTKRELTSIVPLSEFSKFSNVGQPVGNCDLSTVKDFSLDVLLGASVSNMSDSLKMVLRNFDSTKITGGKWQIDELRIDDFLDYINESKDPKIINYKKSLLEKKNLLITKVIKVSGFKAEIYSSKEIKGSVAASLSQEVPLPVITPDSTNNNNNFSVKLGLNRSKKNTVTISSEGQFYIFGMAQRGAKL